MDADKLVRDLNGIEQIEVEFNSKLAPMSDRDLILLVHFSVKNLHRRGIALNYLAIK